MWKDSWLEKNRFPDFLIRYGIRRLLKQRLKELKQDRKTDSRYMDTFTEVLQQKPIAVHTTEANQQNESDWMARYFFTGGMMPSADIFAHFNQHLAVEMQWQVNGKHYQKTCEAWLQKMDALIKQ